MANGSSDLIATTVPAPTPTPAGINNFERYLTVWVVLCIVAGIGLGKALPGVFAAIASAELARVNLIVAVLIWLIIIPMLLKIDFAALGSVRRHWKGVGVTLFINWAVKPFSMAALDRLLGRLGPVSLIALLATLVLLLGFQDEQIVAQPLVIALLAVPILIQVYLNAGSFIG